MRTMLATFVGLLALAAASAQDRTGGPGLRIGRESRSLVGPLGLLALGSLRLELVILFWPGPATCSQRAGSARSQCLCPRQAPTGFSNSHGNFVPATGWECLASGGDGSVQAPNC
jgi:hypothetical protein